MLLKTAISKKGDPKAGFFVKNRIFALCNLKTCMIMFELDETFGMRDLANEPKEVFEDVQYNKTRVSSYGGSLVFTRDKVYFFVAPPDPSLKSPFDFGGAPKSWCLDISEIASHRKYGLGGYMFTLKDGKEVRFTNVFRKLRNGIEEALAERMN